MYETNNAITQKSMSRAESEKVVSVSSRGQATIPKEFREELGIEAPGRVKFVRTDEGDTVVRPIDSVTDLRGVLTDETDEQGRSAVERLRAERERDEASEDELRRRHAENRGDAGDGDDIDDRGEPGDRGDDGDASDTDPAADER